MADRSWGTLDPDYSLQATSLGSYSPWGPQVVTHLGLRGDLEGAGRVAGLSVMIWAPLDWNV